MPKKKEFDRAGAQKRVAAKRAARKEKPFVSLSVFYKRDSADIFPTIRAALKQFYGTERGNGKKTIPALKGRELQARVNQQMRFLHPGMKA